MMEGLKLLEERLYECECEGEGREIPLCCPEGLFASPVYKLGTTHPGVGCNSLLELATHQRRNWGNI